MTATERRIQLAIVLRNRKCDTIDNLSFEFGVCRNTIKNELLFLTDYMCLTTQQGRGGGVKVEGRYREPTELATDEELIVLEKILPYAKCRNAEVLQGLIKKLKKRKIRLR